MQSNCYEVDTQGRAHAVELADGLARWRDGSGTFWIDIESSTDDEATAFLRELGFDADIVAQVFESGHAARTIPFDGGFVFELPLDITGQPAEVKSGVFLCRDRLVVTSRGGRCDASSWIDTGALSRLDLGDGSLIAVVGSFLVELSLNLRRRSLAVRRGLSELSDRMSADPASVDLDQIADLKRAIFDLDSISEEREAALESLMTISRYFRNAPEAMDQLRVAISNTAATARRIDRLDRRASALQARHDAAEQEKANRRLGRLTIISAVFLPLTLIAGIYGMNFEVMPELRYAYAYPVALAGMVLIAIGLVWWFRAKGWMD